MILLSMVSRYNHAIDRTRELLKEKEMKRGIEAEKIDQSIQIIYGRCKMLKNAIFCLSSSIVGSGLIVFFTALQGLTGFALDGVRGFLLILSVGLVVVSTILFVIDILYSLAAIKNEVET
ncbi:MAG TPA: DUF2721 domain-containing protein [Thermodesulfobacteriota bacterium]|nr:DUF2721 domain-containing protein [Thermodesulfobacteriota bacterium]